MLIAFEGGEGAGKSTQARLLADRLDAVLTFEPGASVAGAALRSLLLDPGSDLDPRTEALLMAADRAQHVVHVIRPALERGQHVVTDRYLYSSLAYQGYGRGLPIDDVRALSAFAGAPDADVVVLLTIPTPIRDQRLGDTLDRFEQDRADFHARVEAGFLELAAAAPARWVVIDGSAPPDDVAAAVWKAVQTRLPSA